MISYVEQPHKRISRKAAAPINFEYAVWIFNKRQSSIDEAVVEIVQKLLYAYGVIEEFE